MRQQRLPDRRGVGPHESVQYAGSLRHIIIIIEASIRAWARSRGSIAPSRRDKQIKMSRVTLGGLAWGLALLLAAYNR